MKETIERLRSLTEAKFVAGSTMASFSYQGVSGAGVVIGDDPEESKNVIVAVMMPFGERKSQLRGRRVDYEGRVDAALSGMKSHQPALYSVPKTHVVPIGKLPPSAKRAYAAMASAV